MTCQCAVLCKQAVCTKSGHQPLNYHIYSLPQSVERREGDTACKCIFDGRIQHVYEYALEAN